MFLSDLILTYPIVIEGLALVVKDPYFPAEQLCETTDSERKIHSGVRCKR
jgi:hypothetical protein